MTVRFERTDIAEARRELLRQHAALGAAFAALGDAAQWSALWRGAGGLR